VTTPSAVLLPALDDEIVPEPEVVELEVVEVELAVEIGLVIAISSLTIQTPCSALQHVALFCPQQ